MRDGFNRRDFLAGGTIMVAGTAGTLSAAPRASAEAANPGMTPAPAKSPAPTGINRCPVMHGDSAYKATGNFANMPW